MLRINWISIFRYLTKKVRLIVSEPDFFIIIVAEGFGWIL